LGQIGSRFSSRAIYAVALLVIFGIALSIRVCIPYDSVFGGDWVRFGVNDPWYHMRLVENLVQHFPQRISFDPFAFYPSGLNVPFAPFFDLLLGFVIWVIGLGSPSEHTIEIVGAYFPAILGALVTIPVYFIGRELFNRNVGLLSAGLVAVLPGEFLFRSLLGFTDHHVAEVLFSTLTVLFLILAIKSAREKETSFNHILGRDWKNIRKPLIYTLLTGLTLGMYLLSWVGALLFAFIIVTYMIIQYIIDHLRGKSTDYLCIIGLPSFLIALVMILPFSYPPYPGKSIVIVSLVIGVIAFLGLSGVSRLMDYRKARPFCYPQAIQALAGFDPKVRYSLILLLILLGIALSFVVGGLIGQIIIWALIVGVIFCLASRRGIYVLILSLLFVAGVGLFFLINPSLLGSMLGQFWIFTPSTAIQTVSEARPLLSIDGILVLVNYFTTGIFLALIALGLIIYAVIKEERADRTFLIVWSLIMLAAMLGQRRFAYYFAVNIAILSGYLSWRILEWSYFITARPKRERRKRKAAKRKETRRPVKGYFSARYVFPASMALLIFLVVFLPNILQAVDTARATGGPDEEWHSSLLWMKNNTDLPLGDDASYYEVYERPSAGERFDYPESAYGVMSWWDYGHWITRIAHRIPNANPFQAGARSAAEFFTAQDETTASEILDYLGSRYIVIDRLMAKHEMTPDGIIRGKFYAMIVWSEQDLDEFFEVYYHRTAEGLTPILLYYPEYYRSMCIRLYNFAGEAVVPDNSTLVISYKDTTALGLHYKEISSVEQFATYEEAEAYLQSKDSSYYRIVGDNAFSSPVPLEELEHYTLIHKSPSTVVTRGNDTISYVEIFEYSP